MKTIVKILILTVVLAGGMACTKHNFDPDRMSGYVEHDGSFALPIARSEISFCEILGMIDSLAVKENEEGYLSVFYDSYLESSPVQQMMNISIPNQNVSIPISLSDLTPGAKSGGSLSYSTSEIISLGLGNSDAEIDSMLLKAGNFKFNINSSLGVETTVVFEFPSITQNGRPLKDSVTLQADATVSEVNIPLENYKVDLTTTTKHFNELPVNFSVKVTFPVTLPPTSGSMNLNIGLQNFKYSRIHGYFGYNELIIQSDTIKIDIFKKNPKYYMDRFYFNNPKLTVHYKNSYGVPTTFCFTNLDSYMKTTGQIMDIMTGNPNFPMSETNPYLLTSSSNYQQEAEDSIELNKHNSNLDQIVPNRPEWVHFTAKAATNPSNPTHNNFITDESRLQTRIMVEFPLWGYLYNFWYVDTLNLDLSNIATNYPISRAALMLNLNNGLPVEAYAQLYLADENYQILDSLIRTDDQLVLEAAPLDSNGRVRERVSTKTKLELTSSQIANLKTTKHVLVRLTANTDNAFQGKLMKIYRDYGITLHVGAEVDLDIHGNIDDLLNDNSDKNITINTK